MREFRFRFSRPIKFNVMEVEPTTRFNYEYREIKVFHWDYFMAYAVAKAQFERWIKTPEGKEWYNGG